VHPVSVRVSLEDVRVVLGGSEILHGVSIDLAAGEFLTLLGPSGSGKTTTLNVIAGLVGTTGGDVRFDETSVAGRPSHDRDIGMVFQSYALFPHMTVGQNIEFALHARKVPRAERRGITERALELVQLPGMHGRPITSLSGGQQQRVALARALAPNPSVLLLDEPLAALDKQLRELMQVEIKRIQREVGVTTVAVTHDQTEAMTMSDRVAIMRDGVIEQLDTPETLYRRPATVFAARFLGEANLLPVQDGRLVGFDAPVSAREGTAVVRPEELGLAELAPAESARMTVEVTTASFQGTRYRIECRHPACGAIVATLPPDTPPALIGPGSKLQLARSGTGPVHVLGESLPRALAEAELAASVS
jgi:putative spermidine/putrescine transport system ATP-binding protein